MARFGRDAYVVTAILRFQNWGSKLKKKVYDSKHNPPCHACIDTPTFLITFSSFDF